MKICAIDPGNEESAVVVLEDGKIVEFYKRNNHDIDLPNRCDIYAIEMIASYGMAVGASVFETCFWVGRFYEKIQNTMPQKIAMETRLVYRREVKIHHCGSMKAKDANIRQALIDRFGGKDKAIGLKKTPGPLYGIKADVWAALAVALLVADQAILKTGGMK